MMQQIIPKALFNAAQVRELDRLAIEERHIPGFTLMTRAGEVVYEVIRQHWPDDPITIFCGAGNNGGDGYVMAALAVKDKRRVQVVQMVSAKKLSGDALLAYQKAVESQVSMSDFNAGVDVSSGIIVDAMLGTGLVGEVREPYKTAINFINHSGLPVLAVDIPSGLSSDSGAVLGSSIKAEVTASFIGLKQGLFTCDGPELCGTIVYDDLGVPEDIFSQVDSQVRLIHYEDFAHLFSARSQQSHKGNYGHVLVIGGDLGFGGAVQMSAEAALRVGAGLVSVATRKEHVAAILARRPELMVKGVSIGSDLDELLQAATVLIVGPGLGQSSWSKELLEHAITSDLPIILDADGLNLLVKMGLNAKRHWIMTPHPGEMSRLLDMAIEDVQKDRFSALQALHNKYSCSVMLKGAGSLVWHCEDTTIGICTAGNPGMASGGMGDVLSGVIAGLVAQGLTLDDALFAGVCLHSAAADKASRLGERGMLATDLLVPLRAMVNS